MEYEYLRGHYVYGAVLQHTHQLDYLQMRITYKSASLTFAQNTPRHGILEEFRTNVAQQKFE